MGVAMGRRGLFQANTDALRCNLVSALLPTSAASRLQNQDGVYETIPGVERWSIKHESKKIPSLATVRGFCEAAHKWWSEPGHER